jgi:hypothetical protein
MGRSEFEAWAATWARQIAASPKCWRIAIAGQTLLILAWALLICLGLTPLTSFSTFTLHWWEIQVIYVTAVGIWACTAGSWSGGTLWRWWGTWIYLGIVVPALFLLVFVWWFPLPWGWRLVLFIPLFIGATYATASRSRIADLAFRWTVCGGRKLCDIYPAPRLVFCATEMKDGAHAFFSRDFVYSNTAGIGQPADLRLSTAVQMSANLPVAFPYRVLRLKKHNFWPLSGAKPLYLSDGGVQDNTGVSWFLQASQRVAGLGSLLARSGDVKSAFNQKSEAHTSLEKQYRQRAEAERNRERFGLEYELELSRVAERLRELAKRIQELRKQKEQALPNSVEEFQLEKEIFEHESEKQKVEFSLERNKTDLNRIDEVFEQRRDAISSCKVPTTLRALGASTTSVLLRHGYLVCMNICNLLMDGFPRFDDPPSSEEFLQLAYGVPRQRHPVLVKSAELAS